MNPITHSTRLARATLGGLLLAALTATFALTGAAGTAHADAGDVDTISAPGTGIPRAVATGAAGSIWVVGGNSDAWVAKLDADGAVQGIWPLAPNSIPRSLTLGPDGRMWIAYANAPAVAAVTDAGVVTEYAAPNTANDAMIVGPGGKLWFTSGTGYVVMDTSGTVVSQGALSGSVSDFVIGGDGRIWANDFSNDLLDAIDPATYVVTQYAAGGRPANGMATAPDGSVAVARIADGEIALVANDGTISGTIATPHNSPNYVAYDDADTMWVTYQNTGIVSARLSDGTWIDYPLGAGGGSAWRVIVADDGMVWTTETTTSTVHRITPWSTPTLVAAAPAGGVDQAYSLAASTGAATTSVTAGSLPGGLALDETTGVISGTPTVAGSWSVTLEAVSPVGSVTRTLTFVVTATTVPAQVDGPELADTGARTDGLLALAFLSVGVGAAAVVLARRRAARA